MPFLFTYVKSTSGSLWRKAALFVLAFSIAAYSLLLVIPFNHADAAAPDIATVIWKNGQTKVILEFDQPVHDGANPPGALTASDFTVSGLNSIAISSVEHRPFTPFVIITLASNLNQVLADFSITCASDSVYNPSNEACSAAAQNVYLGQEDTTGPTIVDASIDDDRVFVGFDDVLDDATLTTSNFTLVTADGGDNETITTVESFEEALEIEASGATLAFGSGNTIAATANVTDVFGNAADTTAVTLLPPLKISEVQASSSTNTRDEYIEIYNLSKADFNVGTTSSPNLYLHIWDGVTDRSMPLNIFSGSIPAQSFYLIGTNSTTGAEIDARYSTVDVQLGNNTAAYISLSATADTDVIDSIGFGTSTKREGTALSNLSAGEAYERKAELHSTAADLDSGGLHVNRGNGHDDNDNSTDFVLHNGVGTFGNAQNSESPAEFPRGHHGNEGGDTEAPQVAGSFPSGQNGEIVPSNVTPSLRFNKPMDQSTITTDNITLKLDNQGANLCQFIFYTGPSQDGQPDTTCQLAGELAASSSYTFTVTTDVESVDDVALGSEYSVTFTTPAANTHFQHQSPPRVVESFPANGASAVPPNIDFIGAVFSRDIDSTTLDNTTVTLVDVTDGNAQESLDNGDITSLPVEGSSDGVLITIDDGLLTASSTYRLNFTTDIEDANNNAIEARTIQFTTASANDSTAPVVIGTKPEDGDTNIPVNTLDIRIAVDDLLNPITIDSTTVVVTQGSDVIPAEVFYHMEDREIVVGFEEALEPSTTYDIDLTGPGGIANGSGTDMAANFNFSFTTGAADTDDPVIVSATATQREVRIVFNEVMSDRLVEDLDNWTVESPTGTGISLTTFLNSATWDRDERVARISNLNLTAGNTFSVFANAGLTDVSGNTLNGTTATGTVQDEQTVGDRFGRPGDFRGDIHDHPEGFDEGEFGHVPRAHVEPSNPMAGFTSEYKVEIPISQQISATGNGGKLILTFPDGFDVSGVSDLGFVSDVNGPGPGTIGINSVAPDANAGTVTIDFDTATRCDSGNVDPCAGTDEHDFLRFELGGIVNTTIPKSPETGGYVVDIRTANGTETLQSDAAIPFFIQQSGSNTLDIEFTASGVADATAGFVVDLWSPSTGHISATSSNFATDVSTATFENLPNERYRFRTAEEVLSLEGPDDWFGFKFDGEIDLTGNATQAVDLTSTAGLATLSVNVTGETGKDVDVFVFGATGEIVRRISNTDGDDTVTFALATGNYRVGVGPHHQHDSSTHPEPPNYVIPPQEEIQVSGLLIFEVSDTANDGTVVMDLGTPDESITVEVQNAAGLPISDAKVFAGNPESDTHTFGVTGTDGTATLFINDGKYHVGAFLDGAPPSRISEIVVDSGDVFVNGSNTALVGNLVVAVRKGGNAITGKVTDGTNPVPSSVFAECTANCAGAPFAHTNTGTNGTYQLHVDNGTWSVGAFIPGFGPTAKQTQTVSDASVENVNFSPGNATFNTISGEVCQVDCGFGAPLSGVFVHAFSPSTGTFNETKTGADGSYSLRVEAADDYEIEFFQPGIGPLPGLTGIDVSAADSTGNDRDIGILKSIVFTSLDFEENLLTVEKMFIELVETTTDFRAVGSIDNNFSTSLLVPDGTYRVNIELPGVEIEDADIQSNLGPITVVSSGILTVDGAEAIKIVAPELRTVTVTIEDEENNPEQDAVVEILELATGEKTTAVADSDGEVTFQLPDTDYQIQAFKPGLFVDPVSLTVDENETLTIGGDTATLSIAGTLDVSGTGQEAAIIKASKLGGGDVFATTDEDGDYELFVEPGEYTITGISHGYDPVTLSDPVIITDASSTGDDITLTDAASLEDRKVQSITPGVGGILNNEDTGTKITIPKNAAGTSSNPGTLTEEETNNVQDNATTNVIGNGIDLKMTDASGNPVTEFDQELTLEFERTVAELSAEGIDTQTEADQLKISYLNGSAYVNEQTTKTYLDDSGDVINDPEDDLSDVDKVRFTAQVDHFTVFTITAPADGLAPATPTNVAATAGTSSITVTWDEVTTNSDGSAISDLNGYELYRDTSPTGSFTTQVNGADILTTSFEDSTANSGTRYYYKVTAADTGGLESAKSAEADARIASSGGSSVPSGGGGTGVTITPVTCSISAPAGADVLKGGADALITWASTGAGMDNANLYYSVDNGTIWKLIASGRSASASFTWTVPNTPSSSVKVRVDCRDSGGAVLAQATTDSFTISTNTAIPEVPAPTSDETVATLPEGLMTRAEANEKLPANYPVDTLVKLPDDGDPTTSVDTAVYYIGLDAKRHPFPSGAIFHTWYTDFSEVQTIDSETLASIPLGTAVLVRPGTHWIKIQSDPKVYVVTPGNLLRHIDSEEVAKTLGGEDWNKNIIDIEPTFFSRFSFGDAITESEILRSWPDGALVKSSLDPAVYYIQDGTRRKIGNMDAFKINHFQERFLEATGLSSGWQALPAGAAITAREEGLFSFLIP